MRVEIEKDFQFEAALRSEDASQRIHGYSFKGVVTVWEEIESGSDMTRSPKALGQVVDDAVAPLDHVLLNDVEGLDRPALDHIAAWIVGRLQPHLPNLARVEVGRPSCGERARVHV